MLLASSWKFIKETKSEDANEKQINMYLLTNRYSLVMFCASSNDIASYECSNGLENCAYLWTNIEKYAKSSRYVRLMTNALVEQTKFIK